MYPVIWKLEKFEEMVVLYEPVSGADLCFDPGTLL